MTIWSGQPDWKGKHMYEFSYGFVIHIFSAAIELLCMCGILRMKLVDDGRRIALAAASYGALLLCDAVWGLGPNGVIVYVLLQALLSAVLFQGNAGENILKFFFSVFYVDVVADRLIL